jgi:hypothetical protein
VRIQIALRDCIAERVTSPDEDELSADELSILILTSFFGALLVGPDDPRERATQLHRSLGFFARALKRTHQTFPARAHAATRTTSNSTRTNQGEEH